MPANKLQLPADMTNPTQAAAYLFNVKIEEVTPEMRARAKIILYAYLYGNACFQS